MVDFAFTFLMTKGSEKSVFKPEKKRYFFWLMTAWLVILRFMICPLPRFHSSISTTFLVNFDNCSIWWYSELKSNWCLCLRIWTPYAQMAAELPGAWRNFLFTKRTTKEPWILCFWQSLCIKNSGMTVHTCWNNYQGLEWWPQRCLPLLYMLQKNMLFDILRSLKCWIFLFWSIKYWLRYHFIFIFMLFSGTTFDGS